MQVKIKNKVRFRVQSDCAWQGEIKAEDVLPNQFVNAIGPFVFLKHILSCKQSLPQSYEGFVGKRSQPYSGIATLTYILAGEVKHVDSLGNHTKLSSGGAHWMKAGKGVIHDEAVRSECRITNPDLSIIEFWINLPSKLKSEEPSYFSLPSSEIPKLTLDDSAGWIKVLLGEYKDAVGKLPSQSKEFLYHIHLNAGRQFSTTTDIKFEYAAFLPVSFAVVNGIEFQAGELVAFTSLGELIEITNNRNKAIDIILFGGEPYNESIVAEENFVMNTPHEITQAYNDYYNGKYGQIEIQ